MKTDLEIAEEALAKWSPESLGLLRTAIRDDLMLPAIAAARRATIETCAKVADVYGDSRADSRYENAFEIAEAIRSLAGPTE